MEWCARRPFAAAEFVAHGTGVRHREDAKHADAAIAICTH